MGSPQYFGKLAAFVAAERKDALIPFGLFNVRDNLNFIASIPGPAYPTVAPTPLTFSTNMVINTASGAIFAFTVTANVASITLNYNGGPTVPDGTQIELRITQDGTGGWTVALPVNLVVDEGFAVDPGAGRTTVISMIWNNGTLQWILNSTPFSVTGA